MRKQLFVGILAATLMCSTASLAASAETITVSSICYAEPTASSLFKIKAGPGSEVGSVKISWNAISGATKYKIGLLQTGTAPKTVVKSTSKTSITVSGFDAGATVQFDLSAYDKKGTLLKICSSGTTAKDAISLAECKITVPGYTWSKNAKVTPVVKYNNKTLKLGTDYTVNMRTWEPGNHTLQLAGRGNYKGFVYRDFTVAPPKPTVSCFQNDESVSVTVKSNYPVTVYLRNSKTKAVVAKCELVNPVDGVVKQTFAVEAGTSYKVSAKAVYDAVESNETSCSFTCKKISLTDKRGDWLSDLVGSFNVDWGNKMMKTAGQIQAPSVVITDKGKTRVKPEYKVFYVTKDGEMITLTEGTDYTASFKNNNKVGTGTITVKGKGKYTGTISQTFKIKGQLNSKTVTVKLKQNKMAKYGKELSAVYFNGTKLVENKDYFVVEDDFYHGYGIVGLGKYKTTSGVFWDSVITYKTTDGTWKVTDYDYRV